MYIIMFIGGGINRTQGMGLVVSTAWFWLFAVGCCLQRCLLPRVGIISDVGDLYRV